MSIKGVITNNFYTSFLWVFIAVYKVGLLIIDFGLYGKEGIAKTFIARFLMNGLTHERKYKKLIIANKSQ